MVYLPQMIDGNTWSATVVIDKQSGTVMHIDTEGRYLNKDIDLTINVTPGSVSISNISVTANPTISFDSSTGIVTASVSASESIEGTITSGFVSSGSSSGTASIFGSATYTIPTATVAETLAYLGIT